MDPSVYESQRRGISNQYNQQTAANAYGRFVAQQRGKRGLADAKRNFGRQVPGFTAQWGQRGMTGPGVQSGVFQNAMQRFVGDFQRDYGRMQQDMTSDLQGYDLQQANFEQAKQQALADLRMQQQMQIANTAQQLAALRPFIGGS